MLPTKALAWRALSEVGAKAQSSVAGLVLNFTGRRGAAFPEPGRGPWKEQSSGHDDG